MKVAPESVRELFSWATPQEKKFFRGVPSLANIAKEMQNLQDFLTTGKLTGRRVGMGEAYLLAQEVVGYHSFGIMQNANATPYEREYQDMRSGMNYVYSKKLFVHPAHRDEGIGTELLAKSLAWAEKLGKHYIIDVNVESFEMINLLIQRKFQQDFIWRTPKDEEMIRFFHE